MIGQAPPDFWLEIARTFGFNAVLVLLLMGVLYKLGVLYINEVAIPMNQRLMDSVKHTDEAIDEHTKTLTTIRDTLLAISERLSRLESHVNDNRRRPHHETPA